MRFLVSWYPKQGIVSISRVNVSQRRTYKAFLEGYFRDYFVFVFFELWPKLSVDYSMGYWFWFECYDQHRFNIMIVASSRNQAPILQIKWLIVENTDISCFVITCKTNEVSDSLCLSTKFAYLPCGMLILLKMKVMPLIDCHVVLELQVKWNLIWRLYLPT